MTLTQTWYQWHVVKLFAGVEHSMTSPSKETNPFRSHLVVRILTLCYPKQQVSKMVKQVWHSKINVTCNVRRKP